LKQKHPNIIYLKNDRSKGPSGARNAGILKSSGEYLAFLDSDDIWLGGYLSRGVEILENYPQIDVLFGNFKIVDSKTGKSKNTFFDQKEILFALNTVEITPSVKIIKDNIFSALVKENFFHFGSSIIRRRSIGSLLLNEEVMYSEDRDFGIRLYKVKGATFAYRTDVVFILYRHDDNTLKINDIGCDKKLLESHLHLYLGYLKKLPLSELEKRLLSDLIANRLIGLSYNYRITYKYFRALEAAIKSFKYRISFNQLVELTKIIMQSILRSR